MRSADEYRLRNWLWYRALSGDILVEQNIHIIDLCNWLLGAHPLKARASGGRNIMTHAGDCWDNYQVDFTYPDDVHVSFSSTQFGAYGGFDAGLKMFGGLGMATVPYSGPMQIIGTNAWKLGAKIQRKLELWPPPGVGDSLWPMRLPRTILSLLTAIKNGALSSIVSGPVHNQIASGVGDAL